MDKPKHQKATARIIKINIPDTGEMQLIMSQMKLPCLQQAQLSFGLE